jgi:cobalt-zinc-cadmium efflux system outer membrane protein
MKRRRIPTVFVWTCAIAMMTEASAIGGQAPQTTDLQHGEVHHQGPPVALGELIEEAFSNNPELAALRQHVDAARQGPAQEHALSPPMVEATIWQWPINSLNPANTNMYMFLMGQELPGRGKRDLRAAVAQKDVALAETDVTIRARQLVDEIKQAYASLYIARKAIDVHLASVDLLRQIADVSQAKYATGRISQQDVLKPVLELSKLHTDLLMFDEQANIASARLNVLLNRRPEKPIGPLVEPSETTLLPPTADLQQLAIEHQPELQRAHLEVEHAEAALALAKRDYKPDFSVQGGYVLVPNQTDGLFARVGITWPTAPWARGKIDAHVAELTSAIEVARTRERVMSNSVRLAVHEAYVRAKSAQDRAALLRTTILPQSQQTLAVSRVSYQTDRVDFQALIDNERTLLDAQLDYFRAVSDFEQATADLERAIGTDLPAGTTAPLTVLEGSVR